MINFSTIRKLFLIIFCSLFAGAGIIKAHADQQKIIYEIRLDEDTINPVTAEYISESIDRAQNAGASCLILKLDTPGGLLTSTHTIVKKILSAQIPVVVYISPSGARAGSAGVFITYASHIAAMAPSTNIGAAHPVELGGGKTPGGNWEEMKKLTEKKKNTPEPIDENPMNDKILNDTVAFIKALAAERGRNAQWAIQSVTHSASITNEEALKDHVVEIIAKDDRDLFAQLDGRIVKINGRDVVLKTKDVPIENLPMSARQHFLNVLANPNLAYIFMILGFYGLLYEITHPGTAIPGVLGFIFLVLAFFSMQTLPTNYAGVALIILSLILFIAEAYIPGFGFPTVGGVIAMILGSVLLFDSQAPSMKVSLSLVLAFTFSTTLITGFLARSVVRAHRRKVLSGQEGLLGASGEAQTDISHTREGKVFVHGEIWNAVSDEKIHSGDKIIVEKIDGLKLKVKKHNKE